MDIASVYNALQNKQKGKELPKQNKSLAAICKDVLGISLSKVCLLFFFFCFLDVETLV